MTNSKIRFYKKANINLFRFLLISSYSGKFECPLVQIEGRVFIQYFNVEFKLQNTLQLHWNDITSQLWNCPSGMGNFVSYWAAYNIFNTFARNHVSNITYLDEYICPHVQTAIPMKRCKINFKKTFIYIKMSQKM